MESLKKCGNSLLHKLLATYLNPKRAGGGGGGEGRIHPFHILHDNFVDFFFFEFSATFDAIYIKIRHTVPKLQNIM